MSKARLPPALLYGVLALAVAGPLLAPGLVLAVDLAPVPHPRLPSVYWGIAQGTHEGSLDRLPLDALFVLLGRIGAVAVGEKLLLLSIVFLAGLGMHRAAPSRSETGRAFAGVLYAVNPFVYDRLQAGQWYLLLGYALLPWAFRAFGGLLEGDWRSAWRFGALAVATGVASSHMFVLLGVLCFAATGAALVAGRSKRGRIVASASLGAVLAVLPSLYWLIPTAGVRDLWRHIDGSQLELYRTVADPTVGLGGTVAGLYGFWNDPTPVKTHLAAWPLLALALLALAVWGLRRLARDSTAWAVALTGGFGLVLAMGLGGPAGGAFSWLLDHVDAARSFREPQKTVALLVFAYAYLGAAGVDDLRRSSGVLRLRTAAVALACAVALPLVYGYRELGGLWGTLSTSRYPSSWTEANATLRDEAAGSRTLFLPWHGYLSLSFAGNRVVANPAPSYFDTPILASRSVGEGDAADNSDPLDAYVGRLIARAPAIDDLGACLAPLGVSHVLVAKQADFASYGAVAHQRDLVLERRWGDLALYRNTVPTSLVLAAGGAPSGASCTAVARTLTPVSTIAADPARLQVGATAETAGRIVFTGSYSSDWNLGGAPSRPFLGVVNSFPAGSAANGATLDLATFGAYRRNYLLGLVGALVVMATWLLVPRRRPERAAVATALDPAGASVWVVLPTYNEAENLQPMVESLLGIFRRSGIDGTILVVDDGSPDGTGEIADRLAEHEPAVQVLHRSAKEGLGRAYADGFARALAGGAELVVEMDCDFSHDPEDLPRIVAGAREADLVLGSRYAPGGATENWSFLRKLISRGGCTYARTVLGVHVRDLTGGFKCFRRETLLALDTGGASAAGYGFQIELTYRALTSGFRVVEVPIVFRERRAGASKMSWRIVAEAMLLVPRLRFGTGTPTSSSSISRPAARSSRTT